jgi:hypothetical protein
MLGQLKSKGIAGHDADLGESAHWSRVSSTSNSMACASSVQVVDRTGGEALFGARKILTGPESTGPSPHGRPFV